jgi:hypothetical protein
MTELPEARRPTRPQQVGRRGPGCRHTHSTDTPCSLLPRGALLAEPRTQPPAQASHRHTSGSARRLQVNVTTFSASGVKTVAAREWAETPVQKLARLTAAAEAGPAALPGPAQDAAQKRAVATAQADSPFFCEFLSHAAASRSGGGLRPCATSGAHSALCWQLQGCGQPVVADVVRAMAAAGAGHVQRGQPAQVAGGAAPGPAGRREEGAPLMSTAGNVAFANVLQVRADFRPDAAASADADTASAVITVHVPQEKKQKKKRKAEEAADRKPAGDDWNQGTHAWRPFDRERDLGHAPKPATPAEVSAGQSIMFVAEPRMQS